MVSFDRCEASVLLPYPIAGIVAIEWTESPRSSLLDVLLEQYPRNLERLRGNQNGFLVMSAQAVSVKPPSAHEK